MSLWGEIVDDALGAGKAAVSFGARAAHDVGNVLATTERLSVAGYLGVTGANTGSNSLYSEANNRVKDFNTKTLSGVGNTLNVPLKNVKRGLTTGELLLDEALGGGPTKGISQAWDASQFISPGQEIIAGFNKYVGTQGYMSARDQVNEAIVNRHEMSYIDGNGHLQHGFKNNKWANFISGSSDFAFSFLDPLIALGKVAGVTRAAAFARTATATRAPKIAAEVQTAITPGAETVGAGVWVPKIPEMTLPQIMAIPFVREASNSTVAGSALYLAAKVGKTKATELTSEQMVAQTMLAFLDHPGAADALRGQSRIVADFLDNADNTVNYFNDFGDGEGNLLSAIDPQLVEEYRLADEYLTKALYREGTDGAAGSPMFIAPKKSAYGSNFGVNPNLPFADKITQRAIDKAMKVGDDSIGRFQVDKFRLVPGARLNVFVNWVGQTRPSGSIVLKGMDTGSTYNEIQSYLMRVKGMDSVTRDSWLSRWAETSYETDKLNYVKELNRAVATQAYRDLGYEGDQLLGKVNNLLNRQQIAIDTFKASTENGTKTGVYKVNGVHGDTIVHDAYLTTQLKDAHPIIDVDFLYKNEPLSQFADLSALERLGFKTKTLVGRAIDYGNIVSDNIWKPAVLLRGGFAPRNIFEAYGRLASLGVLTNIVASYGVNGIKNWTSNRIAGMDSIAKKIKYGEDSIEYQQSKMRVINAARVGQDKLVQVQDASGKIKMVPLSESNKPDLIVVSAETRLDNLPPGMVAIPLDPNRLLASDASLFHGTSREIPNDVAIDGASNSWQNLYGGQFYTTESPELANEYRYVKDSGSGERTIYAVKPEFDVVPFNLDQPAPSWLIQHAKDMLLDEDLGAVANFVNENDYGFSELYQSIMSKIDSDPEEFRNLINQNYIMQQFDDYALNDRFYSDLVSFNQVFHQAKTSGAFRSIASAGEFSKNFHTGIAQIFGLEERMGGGYVNASQLNRMNEWMDTFNSVYEDKGFNAMQHTSGSGPEVVIFLSHPDMPLQRVYYPVNELDKGTLGLSNRRVPQKAKPTGERLIGEDEQRTREFEGVFGAGAGDLFDVASAGQTYSNLLSRNVKGSKGSVGGGAYNEGGSPDFIVTNPPKASEYGTLDEVEYGSSDEPSYTMTTSQQKKYDTAIRDFWIDHSRAVTQLVGDPIASRIMRLYGYSVDDFRGSNVAIRTEISKLHSWLKSNHVDAVALRKRYGLNKSEVDARIDEINDTINKIVPQNLRARALKEQISPEEYRQAFGERADYLNRVPQDIPPETAESVVGPLQGEFINQMTDTTGRSLRITQQYRSAVNYLFKIVGSNPENIFVRHPFLAKSYEMRLAEMLNTKAKFGVDVTKLTESEVSALERTAREGALMDLKKTVYTLDRYSNGADTFRILAPFIASVNNTYRTWGTIIKKNPQSLAYINQLFQSPVKAGLMIDLTTGQPVDSDSKLGVIPTSRYGVMMPIPGIAKKLLNIDDRFILAPPITSFNVALQSDPVWLPPWGPYATMAAAAFANTEPDNFLVKRFAGYVFPREGDYNESQVPKDWWKTALPAFVRNFWEKEDANGTVRARVTSLMYLNEIQKITAAGGNVDSIDKKKIEDQVNGYFITKMLGSATLPFSTNIIDPNQLFLLKKLQEYEKVGGVARVNPDGTPMIDAVTGKPVTVDAVTRFINDFSSILGSRQAASAYAFSTTKNVTGSAASLDAYKKLKDLGPDLLGSIAEYNPQVIGALVNDPSGKNDFNSPVYNWQFNNVIGPGAKGENFRAVQDPYDAIRQSEIADGYRQYIDERQKFDAYLKFNGYVTSTGAPSLSSAPDDLKQVWRSYISNLSTQNPAWATAYGDINASKYNDNAKAFQIALNDPKVAAANSSTNSNFPVGTLKNFLDQRNALIGTLFGDKKYTAGVLDQAQYAPAKEQWTNFVAALVDQDPRFAKIYYQFFDGEFTRLENSGG